MESGHMNSPGNDCTFINILAGEHWLISKWFLNGEKYKNESYRAAVPMQYADFSSTSRFFKIINSALQQMY